MQETVTVSTRRDPEKLAARIQVELTSPDPDLDSLVRNVVVELGITEIEAVQLLRRIVREVNARLFPPISRLELMLTRACNLACSYCFEGQILDGRKMSADTARRAIDLLFEYGATVSEMRVTLFGGEPTLNMPALRAAVECAEERAERAGKTIAFNMTSNGVALSQRVVEYLATHRVKVLLSIDGLARSHDLHRVDRGGRGSFDRVIRSMRRLRRVQPWIGTRLTVTPDTVNDLLDNVVGLARLGVNQFVIGPATGIGWSDALQDTYASQWNRLRVWYREQPEGTVRISDFDEGSDREAYFGCQAARSSICVDTDGNINGCAKILALDPAGRIGKLGSLRFGLTHVHNRTQLASCAALRENCRELGIESDYRGGCFATNYEETGDLFQPSLEDHRFSRRLIAGRL